MYRSSLISNTKYDVSFALPKGDQYFGKVTIQFDIKDLTKATKPLFIDYLGTKITNYNVNGKKMTES